MSVYIPKAKNGRQKSPFYHFDFVLRPAGAARSQRYTGSTGQKTPAAARRVEDRLRELAALGKLGNLMTVAEACARYRREVSNLARTEAALRQHEFCLATLVAYYGPDTPLISITPSDVANVVAERTATPCLVRRKIGGVIEWVPGDKMPAPGTVNRQVAEPLRRVMRRARKHWGIPLDLDQFQWGGRDGVMLTEPAGRVREMTPAEEVPFWRALDPDYAPLCELFIISGRRQSNWLDLTKADVDLARGATRMRLLKKRSWEVKWVQLTTRELEIVAAEMKKSPCDYVFTAAPKRKRDGDQRRRITTRMFYLSTKKAFAAAGLRDIRPHDFRHTFASRALRNEPDLRKLQEALDHSSITSTTRYAHVLQEDVTRMRAGVSVARDAGPNVVPMRKRHKRVPE